MPDKERAEAALPHKPDRKVLLVATMRNEGPYILEWLSYHLSIGFTQVLILTNGCIDGSPDLLDCLESRGLVIHLRNDVPDGIEAQLSGYKLAEEHAALANADWAMVLDGDEFLNIHVGQGKITDLLDAIPQATAILVNWRVFGSSGELSFGSDLVTQRFTKAATMNSGVNLPFKTLFREIDKYHCKLLPHQPRFPKDATTKFRYVDSGGRILPAYFFDESRDAFLQSEVGTVCWDLAQVNHYNTRSREDYLVKHQRTNGLNATWVRDDCWPVFDRNEEEDRTILRTFAAAKPLLTALQEDATVRSLHDRCCRLYSQHVVDLKHGDPSAAAFLSAL